MPGVHQAGFRLGQRGGAQAQLEYFSRNYAQMQPGT